MFGCDHIVCKPIHTFVCMTSLPSLQDDEKYAHIENLAKELQNQNVQCNKPFPNCKQYKQMSPSMREDKGKDLNSLGYALPEPIDWMRVQLPKKQDLYQEFYRRIHNFM